jgi:hypothetical protein
MSEREEGYLEECGGANQDGNVPGALDFLEVTKLIAGGLTTMLAQP